MKPVIDHIEITVANMERAMPFYDRLLPMLGYDPAHRSEAVLEEHQKHVVEYEHPTLGFAITSPLQIFANERVNRRKPGSLHHLAFRVETRAQVDQLHSELVALSADIVSPPRVYPEYRPAGYYAVFFKDPDGIKFEVVCTQERDDTEG